MSELKLCPWEHLGGSHKLSVIKAENGINYVSCNCGARGPGYMVKPSAITAWNTRIPDPRLEVAREALEKISRNGNKEEIARVLVGIATEALDKIKGEE